MKKFINSKLGLLIVSLLFFPKIVMADNYWGFLANNTDKTIIFVTDNAGYCIPPHTQQFLNLSTHGEPGNDKSGWRISLPKPDAQVSCNLPTQLLQPKGGISYYDYYFDPNNMIAVSKYFDYPPGPGLTNEFIGVSANYKYQLILDNNYQNIISPDQYNAIWIDQPAVINSFAIADN
jgi:hypothetical protein